MASSNPNIVSKSDFAALSGVAPARVSQWIKERKLTGAAIVGEGRCARINVPIAQQQLRQRLDPNQMTANGSGTDLGTSSSAAPPRSNSPSPPADGLDLTDERARLAKEQADATAMRNAERRGQLIDANDAEQRWVAEIMDIRTHMLAIPAELAIELPELTPTQVDKIDRLIREAMKRASVRNN